MTYAWLVRISHDQVIGPHLLGGISTGAKWKKLPSLRIKRVKFLLPSRSISGCSGTHLNPAAKTETKEGMYFSALPQIAEDFGVDSGPLPSRQSYVKNSPNTKHYTDSPFPCESLNRQI